ncbi:MAG: hypothetical protein F6J93_28825 [Oscillatoria sp. SIO1A7]|nr:hypothetical protein [Oscillatoria sp. SIO1A7]
MEFCEEQALKLVNEAIAEFREKPLRDTETAILRGSWQGQTYQEIGKKHGYSGQYLQRDAGPKFWKLLSEALGEPINKKSVKTVLENKWRSQLASRRLAHSHQAPQTGITGRIGSFPESASSLSEPKLQGEQDLIYEALLRLNYFEQVKLFQKFLYSPSSVGAFLIQGIDPDCGQRWLLNRLVRLVPSLNAAKVVRFKLTSKVLANSTNGLWRKLGGQVGLHGGHPSEIAEALCQCWQSQPVILIFRSSFEEIPQESLSELIEEFWAPVAKMASNRPEARFSVGDAISLGKAQERRSPVHPLLMFLVDESGNLRDSGINCVESLEAGWQPQIPIKLPKIDRLDYRDLADWIKNAINELPFHLTDEIDRTVRSILEQSDNGLPQLAMEEICYLCDCNWDDKERIWLKH